jgi:hypothetical protein
MKPANGISCYPGTAGTRIRILGVECSKQRPADLRLFFPGNISDRHTFLRILNPQLPSVLSVVREPFVQVCVAVRPNWAGVALLAMVIIPESPDAFQIG